MTYQIQAKPTPYAGVLFRSRLEARWAVFFDRMEIGWVYEPERFTFVDEWWRQTCTCSVPQQACTCCTCGRLGVCGWDCSCECVCPFVEKVCTCATPDTLETDETVYTPDFKLTPRSESIWEHPRRNESGRAPSEIYVEVKPSADKFDPETQYRISRAVDYGGPCGRLLILLGEIPDIRDRHQPYHPGLSWAKGCAEVGVQFKPGRVISADVGGSAPSACEDALSEPLGVLNGRIWRSPVESVSFNETSICKAARDAARTARFGLHE